MTTGFLDFTGMSVSEGGGACPNGVMPATVVSAQMTVSSNNVPQIEFKIRVDEPEFAGIERTAWYSLQASTPDKQKGLNQIWAGCFMSIGVTAETIPQLGRISFDQIPGAFVGKACFIEAKERTKNDGSVTQDIAFLKPATYEAKRKVQDANGGLKLDPVPAVTPTATAPAALPPPTALPAAAVAAPAVAAPAVAPVAAPAAAPVTNGVTAAAPVSGGLAALLGRPSA